MMNWIAQLPTTADLSQRTPIESPLVVVVDGGATQSRVAIADSAGNLAGFAMGGPTNWRSVGAETAARNVVDAISSALADGDVEASSVALALVTSASIDTEAHAANLSGPVAERVLPAALVATLPDTIGTWASTNSLGPATAVISGTGSSVVAADRGRGIWRRFGGWDFLLGDEGSGFALGRGALRLAMFVGEGRSDSTRFAEAVLNQAGVSDAEQIPDAVHIPEINKAWIASFAPLVFEFAQAGDQGALEIVEHEAGIIGAACAAGVDALGHDNATLGLFGGTFDAPVWREAFEASVQRQTDRTVSVVVPRHSALVGAFAIAADCLGGRPDQVRTAMDVLDVAVDERRAKSKQQKESAPKSV